MTEEKLQITIYKINEESNLFFKKENQFSDLSDHIKSKGFISQELELDLNENYQIALFYKKNPLKLKWKLFFKSIAKEEQDILKKDQSWSESFILLLLNNASNNFYAITGGFGYHAIQEYIADDFGVDILSHLIKKEDKILKSVKEKSVMGGILGTTKFFRKNYNLFENDSFGKIYQELKSNLNKEILINKFGFSEDDLKNDSSCIAKTSFKINKSITFEQLFQIINGCENIYNDPNLEPISINNVEKIIKKKNQALIELLEKELFNQLWKRFCNEEDSFDFDICNKDFEKYLTASKYIIRKNNSNSNYFGEVVFEKLEAIERLFKEINKIENKPENEKDFIDLIKSLKIYSYDDENENIPLTKGWFIYHIFGDVSYNDEKYFLIDNNWYKIKDLFITELDNSCKSYIENNYDDKLDKKWNFPKDNENKYNSEFISDNPVVDKILVLDKITPENIESCDILKWDDENLYFYHVKAGFGNTMRDLCSQVFIAANKIKNDVNSSKEYVGKIYEQLVSKKDSSDEYYKKVGKQSEVITKDVFMNLFTRKKLIFILAVLDKATNERNLKTNISDFNSNIAKFSLQELVKGMKGIDMDFKISQIFKQD